MSNEWLKDLRRKMEDQSEHVPDRLWDDISAELFGEKQPKEEIFPFVNDDLKASKQVIKRNNFNKFLYRYGSIAAAIIIVFALYEIVDLNQKNVINNGKDKIANPASGSTKSTQHLTKRSGKNTRDDVEFFSDNEIVKDQNSHYDQRQDLHKNLSSATGKTGVNLALDSGLKLKAPEINTVISNLNTTKLTQIYHKETEIVGKTDAVNDYQPLTQEQQDWKEKYEKSEKERIEKNKSSRSWVAGLLAGNSSSGYSGPAQGYALLNEQVLSGGEASASGEEDDPLMCILVSNQDKEVNAKIKYIAPVTFGGSVAKKVGPKWSIGVGVTYTKLSTQLLSGSADSYIKSEQTVHYVGIPVQVNYTVIQKGVFTGYVSGGGIIEKVVSGEVSTKYILENVLKQKTSEKINEKPFQTSINAGMGLQLQIFRNIGLYAEPGIGYHFNDHSSLNTIYKSKPLNFNLKFGLRLGLD